MKIKIGAVQIVPRIRVGFVQRMPKIKYSVRGEKGLDTAIEGALW
jgi:hypothetical protein